MGLKGFDGLLRVVIGDRVWEVMCGVREGVLFFEFC